MILKRFVVVAAAALVAVVALPIRAQSTKKLDISFNNGRVTIVAENVTLAEILAEWSRKGGSKIVNAEQLKGGPVMLTEFKDQPEADVLRTLLREAPGYGAAMRTQAPDGGSTVQTVFILAVRTQVATAAPNTPVNQPQPQPAPQAQPRMIQGTPDDEIPPVRPLVGDQPPSTPGAPAGTNQPTNPNLRMGPNGTVTSTVPGVIIPGPTPTPTPGAGRGRGGGGGGR